MTCNEFSSFNLLTIYLLSEKARAVGQELKKRKQTDLRQALFSCHQLYHHSCQKNLFQFGTCFIVNLMIFQEHSGLTGPSFD